MQDGILYGSEDESDIRGVSGLCETGDTNLVSAPQVGIIKGK